MSGNRADRHLHQRPCSRSPRWSMADATDRLGQRPTRRMSGGGRGSRRVVLRQWSRPLDRRAPATDLARPHPHQLVLEQGLTRDRSTFALESSDQYRHHTRPCARRHTSTHRSWPQLIDKPHGRRGPMRDDCAGRQGTPWGIHRAAHASPWSHLKTGPLAIYRVSRVANAKDAGAGTRRAIACR